MLQIKIIYYRKVWLLMVNDVAPVVVIREYVLGRVNEDFDLVSNFDFKANESHTEFIVQYHAHFFKF